MLREERHSYLLHTIVINGKSPSLEIFLRFDNWKNYYSISEIKVSTDLELKPFVRENKQKHRSFNESIPEAL